MFALEAIRFRTQARVDLDNSEQYLEAVRTAPRRSELMSERLKLLRRVAPSQMVDHLFVRARCLFYPFLKDRICDWDVTPAMRANVPFSMEQFIIGLEEMEVAVEAVYVDAVRAGKLDGRHVRSPRDSLNGSATNIPR